MPEENEQDPFADRPDVQEDTPSDLDYTPDPKDTGGEIEDGRENTTAPDSGEDAPINEPSVGEVEEDTGQMPPSTEPPVVPGSPPVDPSQPPETPPVDPAPVVENGNIPHLGANAATIHEDLKPVVQIMFDGAIHKARRAWEEREIIPGELMEGIFDAMKSYQEAGYHVHVHTDRAQSQTGLTAVFNWMDEQDINIMCLHRCSIDDRLISNAVVTVSDEKYPVVTVSE